MDKLVLKHRFPVKPELLFKAWTTPALMHRWMDGSCQDSSKIDVSNAKVDLRVGGRFELVMAGTLLHHGEYQKIQPPHLLVFTWNSDFAKNSLVTVEIKSLGAESELTLTHERLADDQIKGHNVGWNNVFAHLNNAIKKGELS